MGIPNGAAYVQQAFPDGIPLETALVGPSLLAQVRPALGPVLRGARMGNAIKHVSCAARRPMLIPTAALPACRLREQWRRRLHLEPLLAGLTWPLSCPLCSPLATRPRCWAGCRCWRAPPCRGLLPLRELALQWWWRARAWCPAHWWRSWVRRSALQLSGMQTGHWWSAGRQRPQPRPALAVQRRGRAALDRCAGGEVEC